MTLEHVPPQSFKQKFNVQSIATCLTCNACNNKAGRGIDQAAIDSLKPPKVHVKIDGVSHVASLGRKDGMYTITMEKPPRVLVYPYDKERALEFTVRLVKPRFVAVSWLKSAYLSVFSLLREHGYRYAEGAAIRQVREQIMNPGKEIIKSIPLFGPCKPAGDWIYMNRDPGLPCWVVSFRGVTVLLPTGWDKSFFANLERFVGDHPFDFNGGLFWKRFRFGKSMVGSFSVDKNHTPQKTLGPGPFGRDIRVVEGDVERDFVVADINGLDVTLLPVKTSGQHSPEVR